jgi:hypothetical protein
LQTQVLPDGAQETDVLELSCCMSDVPKSVHVTTAPFDIKQEEGTFTSRVADTTSEIENVRSAPKVAVPEMSYTLESTLASVQTSPGTLAPEDVQAASKCHVPTISPPHG